MKNIILIVGLIFLLSACANPGISSSPVDVAPTPTTPITDTPAATVTPTIVPTVTPTAVPTAIPLPIGSLARQHLEFLSVNIGGREASSIEEAIAANYIYSVFLSLGYEPRIQPFSSVIEGDDQEVVINSKNVIAVKQGISAREIIVGAHYDSVIAGTGADDNASGVAVLLEVAARVMDKETPYTIRFIAFGSEEVEKIGSWHYASQMTEDEIANTIVMINLDSVIAGDYAYVYGDEGSDGVIRDWSLAWAAENGFNLITQPGENEDYPAGTIGDWGDHVAFKSVGIPYTYFESTNWMLGDKNGFTQVDETLGNDGKIIHTQYDDLAYIDATFPGRVNERLRLYISVLYAILTEFTDS